MSFSTSFLQFAIFFGILAVFVEMCGNVKTSSSSDTAETTTDKGRKRRAAEIVHIELLTTLTSAGTAEFAKIEDVVGEDFVEVLLEAHRQVVDGVDGGKVLKYMLMNVDCGDAQLFARAIKDTTSFVIGGTVRCNDQITNF